MKYWGHVTIQSASCLWVAPWDITEWQHLPLKATEIDPLELEHQVSVMWDHGQTRTVIVRPLPGQPGKYEAIGNAWIVAVATKLTDELQDVVNVRIDVRDLTDEDAFCIVGSELESGPSVSNNIRGRFYTATLERFGSRQVAAQACFTSESAISRNLDVVRAVERDSLG